MPENLINDWQKCAPNSKIYNVYGPTEATINCFSYTSKTPKAYNNIVAIGKPMQGVNAIVLDKDNNILSQNEKGELCVSGNQITNGYWKNESKNKEAFGVTNEQRFYKTGDIVFYDNEGDFFYWFSSGGKRKSNFFK